MKRIGRDARRLVGLDQAARRDLVRAAWELALARLELLAANPEAWLASASHPPRPDEPAILDRVATAIPRVAARVPWRATCLVQALAAQRWLAHYGVASELVLGARKAGESSIDAHAWLEAGGRVIVGGETAGFRRFRPNRPGKSG